MKGLMAKWLAIFFATCLLQSLVVAAEPKVGGSSIVSTKNRANVLVAEVRVVELSGHAWLRRNTLDEPLTIGKQLFAKDLLIVANGAFVSLRMADGSRSVLPSSSLIEILDVTPYRIRLNLLRGSIESYVNKREGKRFFEIQTLRGILGVRGTHFRVHVEEESLRTEVLEGSISLQQNKQGTKPQLIEAGFGLLLAGSSDEPTRRELLQVPQGQTLMLEEYTRQIRTQPVSQANAYHLQLAKDPDFMQLVWEQLSPEPIFQADVLVSGTYHARLSVQDELGLEGPARPVALVTLSDPLPEQGIAKVLPDGVVEIRWSGKGGFVYSFELASDASFRDKLVEESKIEGTGLRLQGIKPGAYHWRLSTQSADQTSAISPMWRYGQFEVPANR